MPADTREGPTALDLPMVDPLPDDTQNYFDLCAEKLGLVPNVLRAYAFDIAKLDAFTALYNELMLAPSRPQQARTRDDRGGGQLGEPLLVLPGGPWRGGARAVGRSQAGRGDGDELAGGPAARPAPRDARLRREADGGPAKIDDADREALRACGFLRPGYIGHRQCRRVLQHDQPGGRGHRHATERRLPRAGPMIRRRPPSCRGLAAQPVALCAAELGLPPGAELRVERVEQAGAYALPIGPFQDEAGIARSGRRRHRDPAGLAHRRHRAVELPDPAEPAQPACRPGLRDPVRMQRPMPAAASISAMAPR